MNLVKMTFLSMSSRSLVDRVRRECEALENVMIEKLFQHGKSKLMRKSGMILDGSFLFATVDDAGY